MSAMPTSARADSQFLRPCEVRSTKMQLPDDLDAIASQHSGRDGLKCGRSHSADDHQSWLVNDRIFIDDTHIKNSALDMPIRCTAADSLLRIEQKKIAAKREQAPEATDRAVVLSEPPTGRPWNSPDYHEMLVLWAGPGLHIPLFPRHSPETGHRSSGIGGMWGKTGMARSSRWRRLFFLSDAGTGVATAL